MIGTIIIAAVGYFAALTLAFQMCLDMYRAFAASKNGDVAQLSNRSMNSLCCAIAAIIFAACTRYLTRGLI